MGALTVRTAAIALIATLLVAGCTSQVHAPISGAAVPGTVRAVANVAAQATLAPMSAPISEAAEPTLEQLVGQKLVVRMDGVTPSASLLGRIRRGEVGGIILLGFNITTPSALIALTGQLRAAAAAGGQPPLLIAVDQEGGPIKRIPWAPPTLSPPAMGALGSASVARAQGQETGAALKALGIDIDLAPVADVPG